MASLLQSKISILIPSNFLLQTIYLLSRLAMSLSSGLCCFALLDRTYSLFHNILFFGLNSHFSCSIYSDNSLRKDMWKASFLRSHMMKTGYIRLYTWLITWLGIKFQFQNLFFPQVFKGIALFSFAIFSFDTIKILFFCRTSFLFLITLL